MDMDGRFDLSAEVRCWMVAKLYVSIGDRPSGRPREGLPSAARGKDTKRSGRERSISDASRGNEHDRNGGLRCHTKTLLGSHRRRKVLNVCDQTLFFGRRHVFLPMCPLSPRGARNKFLPRHDFQATAAPKGSKVDASLVHLYRELGHQFHDWMVHGLHLVARDLRSNGVNRGD